MQLLLNFKSKNRRTLWNPFINVSLVAYLILLGMNPKLFIGLADIFVSDL